MNGSWWLPVIDMERCDGCGLCVNSCPGGAVEMRAGRPVIARPLDCAYCGACEDICPQRAIDLIYTIQKKDDV